MIGDRHRAGGDIPALSHQQAEELISSQLDAPLDAADRRTLAAHLAGCPSCAHFASQMGVMSEGLRELPRLPASPTVARQVRERISQPATPWDRLGRLFSGQMGLAPVAATAALLVAVVAGALLFNGGGDETADNPTVPASTQISIDRTLTSTRAADAPSNTPEPGEVLPTATPETPLLPNITSEESSATAVPATATPTSPPTETSTTAPTEVATATVVPEPAETPLPEPSQTPVPDPTETATPTQEPTELPTETATQEPTAVPTDTPVPPTETATEVPPTATEVPPTETATEVAPIATSTTAPTEIPTVIPVATEEPATETPTEEPTEVPTEVPTDVPTEVPSETPTAEPDTATPEPATSTPERTDGGPPTIAPVDETVEVAEDQTPAEQPTDEPSVDEPTETPVDDPDGGPDGGPPTIAPVDDPVDGTDVDPVETTETGSGGPLEETPTGEITEDETPDGESETPDDGREAAGGVLDDTSPIAGLPEGTGAPAGQLAFSPDETLMVVSDTSGLYLQIVETQSGALIQELGAGQYPVWSPLGGILLFNDISEGSTVNAWFRQDNSTFSLSGSDVEDGSYTDVPAGWFDTNAYYLRVYDTGRLSLRAYDANAGATIGEIWSSDSVELAGVRPLQTNAGFLIPTADSWLLIGPDGGEVDLGPNTLGFVGDGLLSPDGSLLAVSGSAGLYIVEAGAPGNVVGQVPYQEQVGAGFSWSPDGAYLAVSDNTSISVYTAAGDPVGAATSETGITIAGLQFQEDGIYFIQTSGDPSLRRFDQNRLLP